MKTNKKISIPEKYAKVNLGSKIAASLYFPEESLPPGCYQSYNGVLPCVYLVYTLSIPCVYPMYSETHKVYLF